MVFSKWFSFGKAAGLLRSPPPSKFLPALDTTVCVGGSSGQESAESIFFSFLLGRSVIRVQCFPHYCKGNREERFAHCKHLRLELM